MIWLRRSRKRLRRSFYYARSLRSKREYYDPEQIPFLFRFSLEKDIIISANLDKKGKVLMKNVIFKGIKALAILFVLYILISLIVPPIFQKEPIELEGAEFAGTGVTERVLCIDDNREALIWRLRLIDRAENEIILSTFDFRVDNSGERYDSGLE